MRGRRASSLMVVLGILGCSGSPNPACEIASWQTLIRQHEARYPGLEMADVYKLLHQATMGSEHAVPSPQMAEDWMKREVATLGVGPAEPRVDTLGATGRFVRVHLRPFLAAGGSADSLVAAFVRTAQHAKPDTVALKCALEAWQERALDNPSPWSIDSVKAFVAARAASGYQAIEHSDAFVAKYRPAYRVVAREMVPR